jgi:phospholipid/cholesterol/gamma-HCH transport system substrate-binding protein
MTPRISGRTARIAAAAALVLLLIGGTVTALRAAGAAHRSHFVAYFDNSNGIFPGDEVVILGVRVGRVDAIEPQPSRAKISFWVDDKYRIPADAKAVILSPQLITSRAIQLTPAYVGGPTLPDNGIIPIERTAVPVEWDDFRQQLQKLTESLQPTQLGGVSPLGAFINTTANNLRGQGTNIRDTIVKLAQSISVLGDHSNDIFTTIKNLSVLVSALHDSTDLMRALNENLAAVTTLVTNDGNELGHFAEDLNSALGDAQSFFDDNREALGTTSDKLASVTTAINNSLDDIKQALHIAPTAFQNFINIYEPAHGALTGALAVNNFANPITFLCGAIQAASRLGAAQAAKLCVQYLAPIIKNRQYNFPPLGLNPFVGAQARPNEVTYSEPWMRPDYVPPPDEPAGPPNPQAAAPYPAEAPPPQGAPPSPPTGAAQSVATDPAAGLPGMMVPPRGGS